MDELLLVDTAIDSAHFGMGAIAKAHKKMRRLSQKHHSEPAAASQSSGGKTDGPPPLGGKALRSDDSFYELSDTRMEESSGIKYLAPPAHLAAKSMGCLFSLRERYRAWSLRNPISYRFGIQIPFGLASVCLFYADIYSDLVLMVDLFETNNPIWGSLTATFIGVQYVACYVGVLFYLRTVYGVECRLCHPFTLFALFGLPIGPPLLDILMFLEPLTLMYVASSHAGSPAEITRPRRIADTLATFARIQVDFAGRAICAAQIFAACVPCDENLAGGDARGAAAVDAAVVHLRTRYGIRPAGCRGQLPH